MSLNENEKNLLRRKLNTNKHEVYVISFDHMDDIIKGNKVIKKSTKKDWTTLMSTVKAGVGNTFAIKDTITAVKLMKELGGSSTKAVIKTYGGKPHLVLTGNPGLRRVLTTNYYKLNSPKVVRMGLARGGAAAKGIKAGGVLTFVFLTAFNVVNHFLTDEPTMTSLIGTIAVDAVKVAITTIASLGALAFATGATTLAIGPIACVLVVGVVVSVGLDYIDAKYNVTNRVIKALDDINDAYEGSKQSFIDDLNKSIDNTIDHAVLTAKSIVVRWTVRRLDKYLGGIYGGIN